VRVAFIGRRPRLLGAACLVLSGGVATAIVLAFSDSSSAAPSKAEYFAQVAAICRFYGPKLDKIEPPGDIGTPGTVAESVRRVLPVLLAQSRELHALRPPDEIASEVERWLALGDRALVTLKRTLREALMPYISRMGLDWLQYLEQNEAAKKVGAGIGFPKVCSSSNSTG
jgi:hypothetical protein